MLLPRLSAYDPAVKSEGSLDPLGLYVIADGLGRRLVPGIRERMTHPRFLTSIAVALEVCKPFLEDGHHRIAQDEASDAIQVFEWHLVEGMMQPPALNIPGLPGRDKATEAVRQGVPLHRGNYLKTPGVFGFYGIYKGLARELDIEAGAMPGECGWRLLEAWTWEQDLPGFIGTTPGSGRSWREQLERAVQDGLEAGSTKRSTTWQGWTFFKNYLRHDQIGLEESRVIVESLRDEMAPLRREMLDYVVSAEGQKIFNSTEADERARRIHERIIVSCSRRMRELLEAVMTFETFARLLDDAFTDCLLEMSRTKGKTYRASLASQESVKRAAQRVGVEYAKLGDLLEPFGLSVMFLDRFEPLSQPSSPKDWVAALLEHHRTVQKNKPPAGKAPWFDLFDDGGCIIRPGYVRDEGGRHDDSYVHDYRVEPLWSFARDLKMVS